MKKTKIVCTIGPASEDLATIRDLIKHGMDIVRLNCSHGTHRELSAIITNVRRAAAELKKPVGILLDLEGPHIRVGEIDNGAVSIQKDQDFILTADQKITGNKDRVPVNYPTLVRDVKAGQVILLDDGNIELKIARVKGRDIHCKVTEGGLLKSHKSVNVPGVYLNLPSLTPKDTDDIRFGIEHKVDFLGKSFVRHPQDIVSIKRILKKYNARIWVVAKIEHPLAVANIDEIIKVSDGIMIARGDLGVELPIEDIPIIQKTIIKKCNQMSKPVITATQMLESMMENLIPTRAETTDVANAIFDGTDAVMLSGETAVGKHPPAVVQMMHKIIMKAESSIDYDNIFLSKRLSRSIGDIPHAISHATVEAAIGLKVKAIITATKSGQTARLVSSHRPNMPIYAVTTDKTVISKLNLLWGVTSFVVKGASHTDQMIRNCMAIAKRQGKVTTGDTVIITSGAPVGISGKTNMLEINVIK
jgi:pyruvate kinase